MFAREFDQLSSINPCLLLHELAADEDERSGVRSGRLSAAPTRPD
jgi:hypothetical protein